MSPGQITEWLAYQRVRGPLGPQRWDYYFAMLMCALTSNPAEDFLPHWEGRSELADPEEFLRRTLAEYEP